MARRHLTLAAVLSTLLLGSCSSASLDSQPTQPVAPTPAQDCASTTTDQAVCMPPSAVNLAALPLGSGKISTGPEVGYEWRCRAPDGTQPVTTPPWVNTRSGTWNLTTKDAVEGYVRFKKKFKAKHEGSNEVLQGNGLPARAGTFPVQPSDPAHRYNPDPTAVFSHNIEVTIPYSPKANAAPGCENGIVGLADNGIPILDAFDADGNDAVGVETQDACHGHPNNLVGYHYHSLSPCLLSTKDLDEHKTVQVGWALDGFGIYVEYVNGKLVTDSQLDGCHGRTSTVPWHGKEVAIYHYDMTFEFPYVVGCFVGTPTPKISGLPF